MRYIVSLFLMISSILFAYPEMLPLPDTTLTEGDSLLIYISALSWQYNSLTFSVNDCSVVDTIWDVGRTGGCTCSETQWSAVCWLKTGCFCAGEYDIIFTGTDTMGVSASDTMLLTVLNRPIPPVIAGIPDTVLPEHDTIFIDLAEYTDDFDHTDSLLTWSLVGSCRLYLDIFDNVARILLMTNFYGTDTVIIRVEDPDGTFDLDTFTVLTLNVNDPPVISAMPETLLAEGGSYQITLDDFVDDPEDAPENIAWNYFGNRIVSVSVSDERIATITASCPISTALDSVFFVATDPGGIADTQLVIVYLMPSDVTEGLPEILEIGSVCPNPFNSAFVVEIPDRAEYTARIFDQHGRLVDVIQSAGNLEYRMEGLPSGTYQLIIVTEGKVTKRKAVYIR